MMAPLLAVLLLAVPPGGAQEGPGATAAGVLQIPIGARPAGMGSAFTGLSDDLSALYYNPAGLSILNSRDASFMYLRGLDGGNLEHFSFGSPVPFPGFTGLGYASLAGGLLLAQHGDIEVNRTFSDGSFRDSRTVSAGGDVVASLAYAERVADTPIEGPARTVHVHHHLGISGKLIRSSLAGEFQAQAAAADLGYLVRSPESGWSLGGSVLNLGTKMTFVEQADPLPLTLRGGGSWKLTPAGLYDLTAAADGLYLFYEKQWRAGLGLEYQLGPLGAFRAGYQLRAGLAGFSFGFGYRWEGLWLDYAWAMSDSINDAHRFSFTYRFGRVAAPERERPRRPFMERTPERPRVPEGLEEERPAFERPRRPRQAPEEQAVPGWIY